MAIFKIPSLDYLLEEAKRVMVRFPFTILSAAGLAVITLMAIHGDFKEATVMTLTKMSLVFALAIPLFVALQLRFERENLLGIHKIAIFIVFIALLLGYYAWVDILSIREGSRYAVFNIVAHLLVAFLPFAGKHEENGFWTFNFLLFLRAILTAVYCIFLLLGILGAIGAIHLLFTLDISWKVYMTISTIIGILLNNFIFLSGIPQDLSTLEDSEFYPDGLKIFTQYILVPLITVYGLILYAYGLMILFTWTLPKGLVIGLMTGFCVSSMFALLLIHPVRERDGNQWIRWFNKGFYIAILPLMLLYFVAIGRRLLQYGFTEDRYFVMVAGLWLVGMAVYFAVSHKKQIIFIPLTLAIVMIASVVGPWSAYSIGAYSQAARFGAILVENALLNSEGKIDSKRSDTKKIPPTDAIELKNVVDYLVVRKQTTYIQSYFKDNISKRDTSFATWKETERVMSLISSDLLKNPDIYVPNEEKSFYAQDPKWLKIDGYQYALRFTINRYGNTSSETFNLDKGTLKLKLNKEDAKIELTYQDKELAVLNLKTLLKNVWDKENREAETNDLTIQTESSKYKIKLILNSLEAQREKGKDAYKVNATTGNLILRIE